MDSLLKGIKKVKSNAEQDMSRVPENWNDMTPDEKSDWLDQAKEWYARTHKAELEQDRKKSREKWLADRKAEYGEDFNEGLYKKVANMLQRLGNERGYPAGYDLSKEIKRNYDLFKQYMQDEDDYEWID